MLKQQPVVRLGNREAGWAPLLNERALSRTVAYFGRRYLRLQPVRSKKLPVPDLGRKYMLYAHVPFCERLCPYCSFNRFSYQDDIAAQYFDDLRTEMRMLASAGYDFDTLYIGGGTPTIDVDQLCQTIDLARELFSIEDVSTETNPNHLIPEVLEPLAQRIQRLSVGVQSSNDSLLQQMDRYEKYGSSDEIFKRIQHVAQYPFTFNVDMMFNFPAQTEEMLIDDIAFVIESGCTQSTFYPLMASPSVEEKLLETVGKVDYNREQRFYEIIWRSLTDAGFGFSSAWTFNRNANTKMVDEYVVNAEEYPGIGSGGITYLGQTIYVNTFSLREYHAAIKAGNLSLMGQVELPRRQQMRYRFMMQLFGLRLDKRQFKADFGLSVEAGLPIEMAFMRANKAFAIDDEKELTLTPAGRYLMVVMMRQFFIAVNTLRDQARAALPEEERCLVFS